MELGERVMVCYAAFDSPSLELVAGIYLLRSQRHLFGLVCPRRLVGALRQT